MQPQKTWEFFQKHLKNCIDICDANTIFTYIIKKYQVLSLSTEKAVHVATQESTYPGPSNKTPSNLSGVVISSCIQEYKHSHYEM